MTSPFSKTVKNARISYLALLIIASQISACGGGASQASSPLPLSSAQSKVGAAPSVFTESTLTLTEQLAPSPVPSTSIPVVALASGAAVSVNEIAVPASIVEAKTTLVTNQVFSGNVVKVGANRDIKTLAHASKTAVDGDLVEIDPGTYLGDVAVWPQNNLTLRGVGGIVILDADGTSAQGKAIFVIQGDNVFVENLAFVNCKVADYNGAGIRHEGGRLVIKTSTFKDNENGILTNNNEAQSLEVYNSQFINNGDGVGYAHNLYAGQIGKLVVEGSYFSRGKQGHLLKSRAKENYIYYNRLTDETGDASYELDLPNGGLSFVIGNIFEQSPNSPNSNIISFGAEGITRWANNSLYFSHNTVSNNRTEGCRFIQTRNGATTHVYNSLFSGQSCDAAQTDTSTFVNSFTVPSSAFLSSNSYDYRLAGTPSINAALITSNINGVSLVPTKEYVHPASTRTLATNPLWPGALQSR
jgi:hypothetical protein